MLNGQDNFLSTLTGRAPLWKAEVWHQRFGLETAPTIGEDWTPFEDAELTVELLRAYSAALRDLARNVLDTTTPQSLDETVRFFTESDPKSSVWALMVTHTLFHTGEIAAIKGVLGGQGLPF
jgi:hypothetical protein